MTNSDRLVEVAAEAMVAVYHAQSFSSPNEKVTPVDRQAARAAIEAYEQAALSGSPEG